MSNTHDRVAHNWAHQTGRCQNGHNMFYRGEAIYSYGMHYCIARFATNEARARCVLFNSEGYSVSTAKHRTITRRAIPDDVPVFEVPFNDRHDMRYAWLGDTHHKGNWDYLRAQYLYQLDKASRARSNKPWRLESAENYRREANAYRDFFELQSLVPEIEDADLETALKNAAEERKQAAARQAKRDRKKLAAWCRGEEGAACPHTSIPYVRVMGDTLETSWGIKVPLKRALAIFRLARICKRTSKRYVPAKHQEIGGWRLDHITSDGTVRAGCHVIPFDIQHRAAKLAGLLRYNAHQGRYNVTQGERG